MTIRAKINELKRARVKKGFSIRGLGQASGLSVATVFKIENDLSVPLPATAKKLCDALDCNFDDLFEIAKKPEVV